MDWCWYLAVKILNMNEQEFLKSTPKKLFKMADIHLKLNSPKDEEEEKKSESKYIDNLIL